MGVRYGCQTLISDYRLTCLSEQRIWEDLRHGIFLGTKKFVQAIKKRYPPDIADGEIPQKALTRGLY